jgi:hypothetical protein
MTAKVFDLRLSLFTVGYIRKSDDSTDDLAVFYLRIRTVLHIETGTVGPPENLVGGFEPFALSDRHENPALVDWKGSSVTMAVMNLQVHILSQQFLLTVVSQHSDTADITEGAFSIHIDSVDTFGG